MKIFKLSFLFILSMSVTIALMPIVLLINVIRFKHKEKIYNYLYNILISLDQFAGTLLYNQVAFTISSYTYYLSTYKKSKLALYFEQLIDFIFYDGHCKESFYNEIKDYKKLLNEFKGV